MTKEFSRQRRVADQIQRHIAEVIRKELGDPRLGMVTITGVEVTPEYERARIFYTVFGDEEQAQATARGLKHAAGFLRRSLAKRLTLRITPELVFEYDTVQERAMRLDALIKSAVAADNADASGNAQAQEDKD